MGKARAISLAVAVVVALAATFVWNASRVGVGVEGCPVGCASTGERKPGALRVVSLNVLHGFPDFERLDERLELVAAEIRQLDADVVCLQEVPWTPEIDGSGAAFLAKRTGLNHVYFRANGNRSTIRFEEGSAILSRFPLMRAEGHELAPRAGFFEHRVVLHAAIDTAFGELDVFSTHLTNGDAEVNRAQAESLLAFVSRPRIGPAVVAGDFNARESSPQIELLSASWIDSFRRAHPDEAGATCCVDDLANADEVLEKRIDYLFVAPGTADGEGVRIGSSRRILARPAAVGGGWLWPSDHVGLFSELSF